MKTLKFINSIKSSATKLKQNFGTPRAILVSLVVVVLYLLGQYLAIHLLHKNVNLLDEYFGFIINSDKFTQMIGLFIELIPNTQISNNVIVRLKRLSVYNLYLFGVLSVVGFIFFGGTWSILFTDLFSFLFELFLHHINTHSRIKVEKTFDFFINFFNK